MLLIVHSNDDNYLFRHSVNVEIVKSGNLYCDQHTKFESHMASFIQWNNDYATL